MGVHILLELLENDPFVCGVLIDNKYFLADLYDHVRIKCFANDSVMRSDS